MSTSLDSLPIILSNSGKASWTSSCSYLGFQPREFEKFWRLQHKRRRKGSLIANSPFIPVNMKEWVDHRLEMILEQIEVQKARIQACKEDGLRTLCIIPAFGGKTGMLRSVALDHFYSRLSCERLSPEELSQDLSETDAFRARAEELLGRDLLKML